MLQCLFALTLVLDLSSDLSVKALNQKNLERRIQKLPPLHAPGKPETLVCVIPLKKLRAQNPQKIDPMTHPAGPVAIDPMIHPTPVQVCPEP